MEDLAGSLHQIDNGIHAWLNAPWQFSHLVEQ